MLIEILLFLFLGILAGIITGLVPGIHINMVGVSLVTLSASLLSQIPTVYLVVFIVSMSISHVFFDFIPSIFLGAPEEGMELSVLPGHEMLKKGLGFQAVYLSCLGCLFGVFIFALMVFPLYLLAGIASKVIVQKVIPIALILISLNLVLVEKKRWPALFVFLFSGILGLTVLNMDLKEPLLPLLTGLFGSASIVLSIKSRTKIVRQKIHEKVTLKKFKPALSAALFSPLSIFLPALSSGQIAVIGNQFFKLERKGFLFSLGTINILTMAFSFLALFLISKTRTGSAVAVQQLLGILTPNIFVLIFFVIIISGFISFFTVRVFARKFLLILEKTNYTKVSYAVLLLILITTFIASGFFGLIVLAVSTLTGIYCISLGVNRINMMGCLILPTVVLYLF